MIQTKTQASFVNPAAQAELSLSLVQSLESTAPMMQLTAFFTKPKS